jgi:hypothetical protein
LDELRTASKVIMATIRAKRRMELLLAIAVIGAACSSPHHTTALRTVQIARMGGRVAVPNGWTQLPLQTSTDPRVVADFRGPDLGNGVIQGATIRVGRDAGDFRENLQTFVALQRTEHPGIQILRHSNLSGGGIAVGAVFEFSYSEQGIDLRKIDILVRRTDGTATHVVEVAPAATFSPNTVNQLINAFGLT